MNRVRLVRGEQVHDAAVAGRTPFDPLVDGDDVLPRPAVGAQVRPRVEVLWRAADPDHCVEATRTAEYLAARPGEAPSVGMALRDSLVRPVDFGEPELVHTPRIVDSRVLVAAACLEQQDAHARGDEPPGDGGPGRAGADDDHVRSGAHCSETTTLFTSVSRSIASLPASRRVRPRPGTRPAPRRAPRGVADDRHRQVKTMLSAGRLPSAGFSA